MFRRDILGKALYEFEGRYAEQIGELDVFGFNAWQIVKFPLYWELLTQDERPQTISGTALPRPKGLFGKISGQLEKIPGLLRLGISLTRLYKRSRGKKDLTLIYAHSVDKAIRNEKGQYFNGLVDPFITNGFITAHIYAETPQEGKYKVPSVIRTDFRTGEGVALYSLIRLFASPSKTVEGPAGRLRQWLVRYFADAGIEVDLPLSFLRSTLERFYSEYRVSLLLLKVVRPRLIITSERPGTGLLAAAKKYTIPSIDLQHGLIDQYHAQYIHAGEMAGIKDKMILPSWLGVFGRLQKDTLLRDGFWKEQEVVILGNSRIQANRDKYAASVFTGAGNLVLVPTQKTAFRELRSLLENLIALEEVKFKIILKIHPLEPTDNTEIYRTIAAQAPDRITLAPKDANTYDLMMEAALVVGFDSAVLLEALSMRKPCITLTTPSSPHGIHGFYPGGGLEEAIRPVDAGDVTTLVGLIDRSMEDKGFYDAWIEKLSAHSDNLYSHDYLLNCKKFINGIFPSN